MDYVTHNITRKRSDWIYQFSVTLHKYVLLGRPDPFTVAHKRGAPDYIISVSQDDYKNAC